MAWWVCEYRQAACSAGPALPLSSWAQGRQVSRAVAHAHRGGERACSRWTQAPRGCPGPTCPWGLQPSPWTPAGPCLDLESKQGGWPAPVPSLRLRAATLPHGGPVFPLRRGQGASALLPHVFLISPSSPQCLIQRISLLRALPDPPTKLQWLGGSLNPSALGSLSSSPQNTRPGLAQAPGYSPAPKCSQSVGPETWRDPEPTIPHSLHSSGPASSWSSFGPAHSCRRVFELAVLSAWNTCPKFPQSSSLTSLWPLLKVTSPERPPGAPYRTAPSLFTALPLSIAPEITLPAPHTQCSCPCPVTPSSPLE